MKDLCKNWCERVVNSLVMDRIAENVPRRLAVVLKGLQLVLQLCEQTCLVQNFFREVIA